VREMKLLTERELAGPKIALVAGESVRCGSVRTDDGCSGPRAPAEGTGGLVAALS